MKNSVLIGMGVAVALVLMMGPLAVQPQVQEVLYLSDSGLPGDGKTKLFRVNLNAVTGRANLILLPSGEIPFNQADALACTPDGAKLYAIDKYGDPNYPGTGKLGYYDVGTASWWEIGYVKHGGSIVPGIVLAAFSPDGILYAASEVTDSLYRVNTGTAVATLVGPVVNQATDAIVNVQGADIVFSADWILYLWANGSRTGAPRGLYTLMLPAALPGTVYATHLGLGDTGSYFTGLAIRDNGWGDLVGSTHQDEIFVIDKANATTIEKFWMYLSCSRYDYEFGDMTVGPLKLCAKTIGYWKNHSWCGATITICGITINEQLGKEILWDARGNNFSMLFAQLIAAKLNTNNSTVIQIINEAEWWLCGQTCTHSGDTLNWNKSFYDKQQKREAAGYWEALDAFNNQFECE